MIMGSIGKWHQYKGQDFIQFLDFTPVETIH